MDNQAHTLCTIYFAAVNLVSFIIYGWDKLYAKKRWWRVPLIFVLQITGVMYLHWLK